MLKLITLIAQDGIGYQFIDEIISSSSMIDVYFSLDRKCVLALYRDSIEQKKREILQDIIGSYQPLISQFAKGEYWKDIFNFPLGFVEWNGRFGVINPIYDKHYFFESGRFQGKEKEGKLFVSAKLRKKFLDVNQKGTWDNYFQMCLKIAQMTKLLHQVGLVYSDLSYKTILCDPLTGNACFTSYHELIILGNEFDCTEPTWDFIPPEVVKTKKSNKNLAYDNFPNKETNNHALAVLIYMFLLYRHPLRGGKVHAMDSTKDEELTMGEKALFIEHPTDKSNRPKINQLHPLELPQGDTNKLPYTICGPYLKELFDKTFIEGLHNPVLRPTAEEWVIALSKTIDLLLPCKNSNCESKWFVFDNSMKPQCPFCGQKYHDKLPVLNFYYPTDNGDFKYENYRLMVYDNQCLHIWHINKLTTPEERFLNENYAPVANFYFSNGKWNLRNIRLDSLYDKDFNTKIEIGQSVELSEGKKILLSTEVGGRLIIVQLVNNIEV